MTFRIRGIAPAFIASFAIVTFKILSDKLIELLSLTPFQLRHLNIDYALQINILRFQDFLNVYMFDRFTWFVEHVNERNDLIRSVFLVVGHDEIWIVKLEILWDVIKFYFRVLANCKLVKPVGAFTGYLLFVSLYCRIHISDVFFVFTAICRSEFHKFGLIWLLLRFLLLFYFIDGQLVFGTFFYGEKLHVVAIVSYVSLANVLLELKNPEIFKLIWKILRLILFMINSLYQCISLTFQRQILDLFFYRLFFLINQWYIKILTRSSSLFSDFLIINLILDFLGHVVWSIEIWVHIFIHILAFAFGVGLEIVFVLKNMFDVQMTLMLLNIIQYHKNVSRNNIFQKVDEDYLVILRVLLFQQQISIAQGVIIIPIHLKTVLIAQNQPLLVKFYFRSESSESSLAKLQKLSVYFRINAKHIFEHFLFTFLLGCLILSLFLQFGVL